MKKVAQVLILCYVLIMLFGGWKLVCAITHPIKYKNLIYETSQKYSLEPSLIASVINVESRYNPNAKSNKGALGLMQIKLSTAEYLIELYNIDEQITEDDLFDPNTNINFGCMYLTYLIEKFENTETALAGYNAGETRVRTWLKDEQYSSDGITLNYIPYSETNNYIKKINKNLKYYSKYY